MKLLAAILIAHCFHSCIAQDNKQLIIEPYRSLWQMDGNNYYQLDKKKKRIYWNNKPIDSTGISLRGKVFIENLLIGFRYIEEKENYSYLFYSIDSNGKIKFLSKLVNIIPYTTRKNFFIKKKFKLSTDDERITHFYDRSFYKLDILTGIPSKFFDMNQTIGLDSLDASDLCALYELPNNKLIATICFCDGGCSDFRYYLIDLLTGKKEQVNLNTKEPNNEFYSVEFITSDEQFNLVEVNHHSIKKENVGFFIYDQNFKEISRALEHEISTIGANYKDGEYLSDNISTVTDDGKEVIIAYKFSMPLERSLYQIFSNQPLFPEDIRQCKLHELEILKNMVFAKHNYKFNSEFYQAYFNFYKFYRDPEKKKNRIKEVSRLLTPVDKSNLTLVTKAIKK